MIKTILIITAIIATIIIIPLLWNVFYYKYIKKVKGDYNKDVLDFDSITKDSAVVDRILKLYWNRQQTYEFSGYAILLLCILFLFGCIGIFIFSNEIVISSGIKPGTQDFWISLLSLRIGISLIVFFICQILLKLYRYCVKFAVFYIGLFDSLMIYKAIEKDLKETIGMFMPNVDIGENPKNPISEIVQILSNVEKVKSAASK